MFSRTPAATILVAITPEFLPKTDDSAAFANSVLAKPELTFSPSDTRGTTLVSAQGDHATAYALYWESIRVETASIIMEPGYHVSVFTTNIYARPKHDEAALKACDLYPDITSLSKNIIDVLLSGVIELTKNPVVPKADGDPLRCCRENLKACKEELVKYKTKKRDPKVGQEIKNLEKIANGLLVQLQLIQHFEDWSETFSRLSQHVETLRDFYQKEMQVIAKEEKEINEIILEHKLTPKQIKNLKNQNERKLRRKQELKKEYFYKILQKLSEQYLLYQNQMPYITFERILEQLPAPGEGPRVSAALAALRGFNDSTEPLSDQDYKDIQDKIKNLLFLPKIKDDVLQNLNAQKDELLSNNRIKNWLQYILVRDNNPKVFSYVVARHLQTIFDAFPRFSSDGIRQKITESFVENMLNEWGFALGDPDRVFCLDKIKELLELYQKPQQEIDASLSSQKSAVSSPAEKFIDSETESVDEPPPTESVDKPPLTESVDEPPPKRQRTLLTMFAEQSEKNKTKVKSVSPQVDEPQNPTNKP